MTYNEVITAFDTALNICNEQFNGTSIVVPQKNYEILFSYGNLDRDDSSELIAFANC